MKHEASSARAGAEVTRLANRIAPAQSAAREAGDATGRRAKTKIAPESPLMRFSRWRQLLRQIEVEAAKHKCVEVEVLTGVTMLAVDDLIKASMRSHNGRRQAG